MNLQPTTVNFDRQYVIAKVTDASAVPDDLLLTGRILQQPLVRRRCFAVIIGIGLPLMNLGHRAVPTAQISLLMMTELVLAPIWVWIWPGETPSVATLAGGAIVIGAVAWQVVGSNNAVATVSPGPQVT